MAILEAEELMLCNANPRQLATALSIAPLATYQAPYSSWIETWSGRSRRFSSDTASGSSPTGRWPRGCSVERLLRRSPGDV
jgi:hypothetical protein